MGLFDKVAPAPAGSPPFAKDRWPAILQSMDINFGTDGDGDYVADWDGIRVWFMARGDQGEIMFIQALWDVRPPLGEADRVAVVLNAWNSQKIWPKASVSRTESECLVFGELALDLETGASDDFLRQQVRCVLSTSFSLVEYLVEELPEHTTWRNIAAE
ncbi:MAG: YbjN domain-containing protein [Phycicoccus sp.]|nr:YbjN domain-containing protein [Phycicoccus sp.]